MGGSTRAARPVMAGATPRPRTPEPGGTRRRGRGRFTGIVEERGEVVAVDRHAGAASIRVRGPRVTADASPGDSIAVNGVCLTVTAPSGSTFTADVMAETLRR